MTAPAENQVQTQENKPTDKELNFRALQQKYQKELEDERQARLEAERRYQEAQSKQMVSQEEEEEDSEPYVDHKRLKKEQAKFGQQLKQQTQTEIQKAVSLALEKERQQNWLKQNNDFNEVMQHAEKIYLKDPELAETILAMPEGFERTKLAYQTVKALGLHRPEVKQTTIQDKVDANKRGAFYQPTNVGAGPYSPQGDFSKAGQKAAYEKLQELKARLRV